MMRNGSTYERGRTALLTNETVTVPDHVAANPRRHDTPDGCFMAIRADGSDVWVHVHADQSDMYGDGEMVVWIA